MPNTCVQDCPSTSKSRRRTCRFIWGVAASQRRTSKCVESSSCSATRTLRVISSWDATSMWRRHVTCDDCGAAIRWIFEWAKKMAVFQDCTGLNISKLRLYQTTDFHNLLLYCNSLKFRLVRQTEIHIMSIRWHIENCFSIQISIVHAT